MSVKNRNTSTQTVMLNSLINIMKWPTALSLAFFAWFAADQLPSQVGLLLQLKPVWVPLVIGVVGYALLWHRWLRTNRTAAWVGVMEHELTHVLASLGTFNGVHRLQADSSGNGHIAVPTGGNWIIFVAPYVFPTVLIVPALFIAAALPSWFSFGLFGFSLGFHVQTTYAETHLRQTDLKKVGWPTAALVLPACHIIFALVIVGMLVGHQNGVSQAWKQTRASIAKSIPVMLMAVRA